MMTFVFVAVLAAVSYGASIPKNRVSGIEGYIVGGKDTDISEVPYQVAIYRDDEFMCGGSVLSHNMIVTSARCIYLEEDFDFTIRAGSSYLNKGGVVVKAKRLILHPKFNHLSMDYDVALVELEEALTFSDTVRPIKLATSEPADGAQVKVSGYGLLEDDGDPATTLQSVLVPVVGRDTCTQSYSRYLDVTPRMICAGTEDKDACYGDGGGPLNDNGQLVGIVSFGLACGFPGIYTNVADPEITAFIRKNANI